MNVLLSGIMMLVSFLGQGVQAAPAAILAFDQLHGRLELAAETLDIIQDRAEVPVPASEGTAPDNDLDSDQVIVTGTISIGEASLPFEVSAKLAEDGQDVGEPTTLHIKIGEAILSGEQLENLPEPMGQVLTALGRYRVSGLTMQFCLDQLCVRATTTARITKYRTEVPVPTPTQPTQPTQPAQSPTP